MPRKKVPTHPKSWAHAAWRMAYYTSASWDSIASVLGYANGKSAAAAARRFAYQDGRPWPPEDQA